ncbi:MAG: DUF2809 domain-containing protein [Ruthenibacterium sp.]
MKKRLPYLLVTLLFAALGIVLRMFTASLPLFLANYLPDVIWAGAVYCFVAFLLAGNPLWHALAALVVSFAVEFLQLYQATWIVSVRSTLVGRYLLGTGFLWSDLVCYAVGVLLCFLVDFAIFSKKPKVRPSKYRK